MKKAGKRERKVNVNKVDWKRKLTSRKLWAAAAGFAAGLIVAFGGSREAAETVSGCIMSGAAVIAYIIGEGIADVAGVGSTKENSEQE